jgi:hypothetical protein
MAAVMLVLLAPSIMAGATFAAVGADIPFTRASQDRKEAYAAAEGGIEYYLYQLTRDNDYWRKCATAPGPEGQPNPVNDVHPLAKDRRWRTLTGTTDARFSIELLPANGADKCLVAEDGKPTLPDETMIDKSTGTFRIRATGESRGVRRSIVTTFRRSSFLDFIYFTDYEALDPLTFASTTDQNTARSRCVKYRQERDKDSWCAANVNITFPDWDRINGPLHTNDDLLTCGSPVFGRKDKHDAIEISGLEAPGWHTKEGCGSPPKFEGVLRQPWDHMDIPPSNENLKNAALSNYIFYGQTTINLQADGRMDVVTHTSTGANATYTDMLYPSNGVVFVEKTPGQTCSIPSPVRIEYAGSTNVAGPHCAILTLHGTYNKSLTLGSRDDILIDADVKQQLLSDSVLGLIAQRFVRVKHDPQNTCDAAHTWKMDNVTIEAAILALNDSFIVDNWQCGDPLQTLTVVGAIAQKFRGPVGMFTGAGTRIHGYAKNYNYDDRLRYRSPPYFLEPVKAAWKIVRNNEQVPAAE